MSERISWSIILGVGRRGRADHGPKLAAGCRLESGCALSLAKGRLDKGTQWAILLKWSTTSGMVRLLQEEGRLVTKSTEMWDHQKTWWGLAGRCAENSTSWVHSSRVIHQNCYLVCWIPGWQLNIPTWASHVNGPVSSDRSWLPTLTPFWKLYEALLQSTQKRNKLRSVCGPQFLRALLLLSGGWSEKQACQSLRQIWTCPSKGVGDTGQPMMKATGLWS